MALPEGGADEEEVCGNEMVGAHPSPGMVVAVVALLAAVAGTAVADPGASTSALSKKTVKKIANKQITKRAPGLTVAKATDADHATSADNAANATNAAHLEGQTAAQLQASFTHGRGDTGSCNPTSATFVNCATITTTLPSSGRVLVVGNAAWHSDTSPTFGTCRLLADGTIVGNAVPSGELLNVTDPTHEMIAGLNGVTGVLGAGSHTITLQCNEEEGDIDIDEAMLSAVMVGTG